MVAHANPGAMVVCGRDLGIADYFFVMVDDALSLRPVGMAVAFLNVWPFAAALTWLRAPVFGCHFLFLLNEHHFHA